MISKPGRNDPCPCGSGRKYKQCCLPREQVQPVNSSALELQLRQAMQAAWTHNQQGNLAQAEAICQQILHAAPKQADAWHLLGAIALQQGNLEVAIPQLARAVKARPDNPEFLANLGLARHERGELDEALRCYGKALAIAPDYANALFNQHALLLNGNALALAIENLKRALSVNPGDADARYSLGVLLDYMGQPEQASKYLDALAQGSALDRARLDAWQYLSSASNKRLPITGSAIQTFRLALQAAPKDGMVLEFGVRFGTSIRQIASLVKQDVHGFDSFEGLPEVWHHEPKGSYTTKGVIPSVPAKVKLHVGWFEDTLPEFLAEHKGVVRLINVDCDIYSSTKTILQLLAARIVAGSVIVFDEYIGNENWREDEYKAFHEAVAKNGWSYEYLSFSLFTKQVTLRIL